MGKERPEHVKCGNCIFYDDHGQHYGACHRQPPAAPPSVSLKHALAQIHWVLSGGGKKFTDDSSMGLFDPESGRVDDMNANNFACTSDDEWCGEFRSEWPQ